MKPLALVPLLAPVVLLIGCVSHAPAARSSYDVIIRHGRVLDGTGTPAVPADVAIRDGRVAAIGAELAGTAKTEIDARGKIVAPGFIDVHTHCEDIAQLPQAENFLRMGVTTIVTGNCGSSATNVGEFFDGIVRTGVAINVATLIGQGSVRSAVMGGSFMRPPTPAELDQMRALVDRGMRDGAVGLSTGLIYLPGTFTKTDEIIELAKVAAAHDGIYASHMRYENARIFEALDEVAAIARGAHIRAEVSHIKLGSPAAWGRADEVIAWLQKRRAEGLDITEDQYVYTASSTGIATMAPSDVLEGGNAAFRARLADPEQKAKMVAAMKGTLRSRQSADFSYAVIASYRRDPRLNGKTIAQAAQLLHGSDSVDTQIETILEITANGGAQGVFHGMNENDLRKFLVQPLTMIASDSGVRKFGEGVPHPRGYGNNARVLGVYVRELKLLTLEDAVRKMTSLPARTFHLKDRGELKTGSMADVVVFDPATVGAPSSYDDPHHYATGFSDVLVNGVPVVRGGEVTASRPGRPVKLTD